MAVARKIKTLLTVNILVFVGIILFSVYCRLQDRSEALVQVVRGADRRVRNRLTKAGALADREAILQRLDHLEEVVYNQLNGLAKPIGLVEGPGGLGQGGVAATLQDDSQEAEGKFEEFGYNAQLSDRISLDRTIPDYRPKRSSSMLGEALPAEACAPSLASQSMRMMGTNYRKLSQEHAEAAENKRTKNRSSGMSGHVG